MYKRQPVGSPAHSITTNHNATVLTICRSEQLESAMSESTLRKYGDVEGKHEGEEAIPDNSAAEEAPGAEIEQQ